MKILFIAHYCQPEPGFFFAVPLAKALKDRGHSVEILTGYPNYPTGKIHDGYRQSLGMTEMIDGIKITRMPLYINHTQSGLKRAISYTSLSFMQALTAFFKRFHADVAYVSQGPATIGLPAIFFRWLQKIPYVYHIQDLWPDSLSATGMFHSPCGLKLVDKWCRLVYRQAAHVIVQAPGMQRCLTERGVPLAKISYLYNWQNDPPPLMQPDPQRWAHILQPGFFHVVYTGNLGNAQDLGHVIQAANILKDTPQICFTFVGSGVALTQLQQQAAMYHLDNIHFGGRVAPTEVQSLMATADVLLCHLKKCDLFDMTIPSKIQGYLVAGKPIVAAAGKDAGELVKKAGAGLVAESGNPESIAQAVLQLFQMPKVELQTLGYAGRKFYDDNLSEAVAAEFIEHALYSACHPQPK